MTEEQIINRTLAEIKEIAEEHRIYSLSVDDLRKIHDLIREAMRDARRELARGN